MWTVDHVLEGCKGQCEGESSRERPFEGFSIDTRTIQENNLFFALSGPHFDGHRFVEQAIQKRGQGAVVAKHVFNQYKEKWLRQNPRFFFILVEDPLCALQDLAKWHRKQFTLPVVGITGSNGKTSTKEMLASILFHQGNVLKTEGNLNNHIGLPLTLLRLNKTHDSAVIEMGISKKKEMAHLCDISQPTTGLITNIGPAHLEGLGSLEGVEQEKSHLFQSVKKCGTAIINRDDPFLQPWENQIPDAWTFGLQQTPETAHITADNIVAKNDNTSFKLHQNRSMKSIDIMLPIPGQHQVLNALGASAVAASLDIPIEAISKGLSKIKGLSQRIEKLQAKGITILFDAYNANPASVKAALDLLATSTHGKGKRIALLGDMLELGDYSDAAHRQLGKTVASHGIDLLIVIGKSANQTAAGAISEGMSTDKISVHTDFLDIKPVLEDKINPGDTVLIKGSRVMKMERLLPCFGLTESGQEESI